MKIARVLLIANIALCMSSCHGSRQSKGSSCAPADSLQQINLVKASTATPFTGIWGNIFKNSWAQRSYLDDLLKTKSPCKSQNKLSAIVEIVFDTSGIKGDSLQFYGPNIHEGGNTYYLYLTQILH